ncbi:MAG: isocitrate/isopropylmalate dehydrogenase family protein [Bryobacteraceae bacterium]
MKKVALIAGDGIGPEIAGAARAVLEAAGASLEWTPAPMGQQAQERYGAPVPLESLETVRSLGVALKGPMIAERRSGGVVVGERRYPSINAAIRRELGAYANVRPVRGWEGVSGRYTAMDVVLVRELTEDMYAGLERQVDPDTAEAVKRITRGASTRVARFACEYALRAGRRKITAVHKANVLHLTDGLFLESVRAAVAEYPGLEFDDRMVDAASYALIKSPEALDVLVLPNQYGDILSDMAAGLAGSLGLAPGANIGDGAAVFEAAHGAAPDIAGKGLANPISLILSGAMMLDWIGQQEAAERVRTAVRAVLREGAQLTPDLGGTADTGALTRALCAAARPR